MGGWLVGWLDVGDVGGLFGSCGGGVVDCRVIESRTTAVVHNR